MNIKNKIGGNIQIAPKTMMNKPSKQGQQQMNIQQQIQQLYTM